MLKYECRPGQEVEDDDTALTNDDATRIDLNIPEPIHQDILPAGPKPLQVVDHVPPTPLILPNPVIKQRSGK